MMAARSVAVGRKLKTGPGVEGAFQGLSIDDVPCLKVISRNIVVE